MLLSSFLDPSAKRANDTFPFAAELPSIAAGVVIKDLTFHTGDSSDWYVLRPQSSNSFAGQSIGVLDRTMIRALELDFMNGQLVPTNQDLAFSLYLVEQIGSSDEMVLNPVDSIPGNAPAVLLRVDNRLEATGVSSATGRYQLAFASPLGETIDVSVADLTADASDAKGFSRPAGTIGVRVEWSNPGRTGRGDSRRRHQWR